MKVAAGTGQDRLAQCNARLLTCVINGHDLQQIADIGYELLGNPLTIFDNSFKYLAFSQNIDVDCPLWRNMKINGYISYEAITLLKADKLLDLGYNKKYPFIVEKGRYGYQRIVSYIFVNNKPVATLVVYEYKKPFSETDLQITDLLCKVLSLEMQKNSFISHSKGLAYEYFINDLLDGKTNDRDIIQERIKSLDWLIEEILYILTVDISEFDRTHRTLHFLRNMIEGMVSGCKSIVYNDRIVLVITRSRSNPLSGTDLSKIAEFFEKNSIYGGLSREFHNLEFMKDHYEQSVTALKLGRRIKKGNPLFYYDDFIIYYLLDLASQQGELTQLCKPALLKLMEYDRKNNTSYVKILYCYLVNERNITHTSTALDTHRNTLVYRIEKIKDILNVNLDDSEVRLKLLVSYKMLELMGTYQDISIT
ncbi:MAG: helix-turn-helix domain-containing protein [Peptococcaceae bacterium]|nr:helix-turn-helix domain-containing protein [Peptococcaceae bacterium]